MTNAASSVWFKLGHSQIPTTLANATLQAATPRRQCTPGSKGLRAEPWPFFYANFARDESSTWQTAKLGCQDDPAQQVRQGRLTVTVILSDLLLFFCLAAF